MGLGPRACQGDAPGELAVTAAARRADDLSIYVLPGRAPDPTVGLQEANDAEAAGFGGIYVSERLTSKTPLSYVVRSSRD